MATPFDGSGALDLDGAAQLARWLVEHGSDSLVVAGTTGESSTLSDQEKLSLWETVSAAVTVPVIAGSGTNDTAHSVELTAKASSVGVAGVLAVTPYYNRPSQEGLKAHFGAVAAATDLPVILYDIPGRTGRRLASSTILSLARDVSNIVAVKDAAGDVGAAARVIAAAPAGFELYSGDDALTLPLLSVGAVGVIGVATHWAGEYFAELIQHVRKGDLERAAATNAKLFSSYDFQTSEEAPNPVPVKTMLSVMSLPSGPTRAPMGPPPAGLADAAQAVLDGLARG